MPPQPLSPLLLPLLLLLLLPTTTISFTPIYGLDSFLTHQSHLDPHSSNDSFLSLPSSLKSPLSHPYPTHPPSPASLLSFQISTPITIKLIGPSFSPSSISYLTSLLSSSISSDLFHVITPSSPTHHLSISHNLHLDVSLSSPSLASHLTDTIKSHIASSTSSLRSNLVSLPHTSIDEIIKRDFEKEKHSNGVYVYVINLGLKEKNYAYSYRSGGDDSLAFTKCLGSVWTGNERYLWIDLGAGPVDYGPSLSGDGLLPRGEFHPLAAVHGGGKSDKALVSDVASLVWSAYNVLLVPSLRIPVVFENSLVVQFIHIRGSAENKDDLGLDWKLIERRFVDEVGEKGLLLGDQTLSFKKYEVNYRECSICSFAISRATTSYTSRYLFDNYTLIVSEYLDSKRLHQILTNSVDEVRRVAGLPEEDFARVLPVYVFDLDVNSILSLDRYHQSVAFKDMVIAIRTKNSQTVSDYSCNGRHVFTQTRELERPLVGSILQSMWGVAPTHLVWSPRHNNTLVDYTWSMGQTPFGPFSEISSLSFVQKDAARRNVLLTSLNFSISSAIDVLDSIAAHGGERKLLKRKQQTEFFQRWNLFKYKLDKVVSAMSHYDFGMAMYYLRSSDHDLYAIHSLVYNASQDLEASLVCFKDPPIPWASVSMSAVVFVAVLYAYLKRDKLFHNKRKQF